MPTTPPPPELLPGYEVPTKHKEAIRQLHGFAKIPIEAIMDQYKLSKSGVRKILDYEAPERARPTRTGRPRKLNDLQVHEIIEYCSQSWEHRILDYTRLRQELDLACSPKTLERRLKQCGYFRCVACQKPYLTLVQAHARWIWGIC
jgi:transposase